MTQRLTSEQLQAHLAQCTGTSGYFQHPLWKGIYYTDGVQQLAEQGGTHGAYWLLDLLLPKCKELTGNGAQPFLSITVTSKNNRGTIRITDGDDEAALYTKRIDYTDLQPGEYKMYCVQAELPVLQLASEY